MAKVLILDQSKSMRNTLRERLEFEGFSTEAAEDEEAASTMCEKIPFDVILSDRGCKIPDAGIPFIVLSAEASIDSAVEAVRNGAQDYLTKPIDMNRLLQSIHRTIDNPAPAPACAPAAAPARRSRRSRNMHTEQIIGTSPQMEHVRQLIDKVAPCEARVLITGENGTGKELVARWLHAKSSRAAAPFVEVNCAAIPSELIESELFGHEKGAFTSAIKQRKGKFEQADGGTLFMDEIGDMSLAAQAKVLRALQENKICRVGSDKDIDVDVRVIAATNKNLRDEITKVQEPARRDHEGQLPRRPLPPYRRNRGARSGAARPRAGRSAAGRPFHPHDLHRIRHPAQTHREQRPARTADDAVERQHPRTAQRHRAAHHPQRRAHHARRREDLLLKKRQPALADRLSLFRTELPDYSRSRISAGLSTI